MSLSLPYDLDFVPLDILTAEELNQLQANIQYVANQFPISAENIASSAITTAKIADGAVTSGKVTWSFTDYSSSVTAEKGTLVSAMSFAVVYPSRLAFFNIALTNATGITGSQGAELAVASLPAGMSPSGNRGFTGNIKYGSTYYATSFYINASTMKMMMSLPATFSNATLASIRIDGSYLIKAS